MSHFTIVADTDDHAYGASACSNLANTDPNKAINNADNHEYMAENDPNLSCVASPPTTTPPPTPQPTPTPGCPTNQARLEIELLTDNYPGETSYTLTNKCTGQVTMNKAQGSFGVKNTMYKENLCVPDAQYEFTISDTPYADGVCCGYGNGSYKVMYKGVQEKLGGEFGGSETTTFGSCGVASTPHPTTKVCIIFL